MPFVSQQSPITPSRSRKGKAAALVSTVDSLEQQIMDVGASHHKGYVKEQWSLLEPCPVPHVIIEDESPVEVIDRVMLMLPLLHLSMLFVCLIYQLTFSPSIKFLRMVEKLSSFPILTITNLEDNALLAVGKADHESWLYAFSHFLLDTYSISFLTHSNSMR